MNNINIRQIEIDDLWNGFLTTLDSLREASNISRDKAEQVFERIKSNPDHIIVVASLEGKIVGSTTLLIEPKFIHDGGKVGHIEDVVVDKNHQGKKIGEKIIRYCLELAKEKGCYKTILDCSDEVKPFYEKLGFKHNANALRYDHF